MTETGREACNKRNRGQYIPLVGQLVPMRDYERLKSLFPLHHLHFSPYISLLSPVPFLFSLFLRVRLYHSLSPSSASVPQRNLWGPRRGPIPTVEPTTVIARSSRPANQHSLLHFCSGRFREIHSTSHLSFDQSAQSLLLYYHRFILVPFLP